MRETLGRYTLVKKLAVGGMGEVFLARQRGPVGFEKLVVVKTLLQHLKEDQDFVNMFFDEARIAAVLNHPNIAQIYDLGEDKGEYYIAMEYVHGHSLRDVVVDALERKGSMPLALKLKVIADAAAALDFAHQARTPSGQLLDLIHRDVSPQNILIGFNGSVKLIDFGVAKAANKLVRTATGIIKGKYAYMSPEQAYGKPLDGRSDVFGLGTVLWEILTSERLFKRENETETLQAVVGAEILPPSQLDRSVTRVLDAVVMKALERNVKDRYQSAAEFQRAIESFLSRQRVPATAAHLAAFMKELYPGGEDPSPVRTGEHEISISTDTSAPQLADPKALKRSKVLDHEELEARVAATQPTDTVHGVLFNALISAVLRSLGAAAEPKVRRAGGGAEKVWVDSLAYPTGDFLRMLWRAVELLAPARRSVDEAFEHLGEYSMDAVLKSPFGRKLESFKSVTPATVFKPLIQTLNPMIAPGQRVVTAVEEPSVGSDHGGSVTIVFKEEVLPIQLYIGLFSSLVRDFSGRKTNATWDKVAAERVEVVLTFE